ncbi:LOW QUALITY PROTEIN: hypothetical protein PFNF135_04372 [Plasmodium falciparum NF135/5.C10]|uniref:Uncharacterized protein n=1 Tax=Plasmodium falciparum NF135/5.C10 TaxID=1036726 RepID=W4ICH1_PLAFA|nr:LOW QUALITY PROTEIN: hypothetical protein PFNF135_04372 [Plasmodium falciparum NF135/5.C10]
MKKIYKKKYKSEKKKKKHNYLHNNILLYVLKTKKKIHKIFIHIQIRPIYPYKLLLYLINSKYMLLYTCDRNNEKINKERK